MSIEFFQYKGFKIFLAKGTFCFCYFEGC